LGENKLCYGCMEHIGNNTTCPNCGYTSNTPYLAPYIVPGTILNDRYLIGKTLNFNGEGATYLAYDKVISCKILVREYMPDNLCTRVKGTPVINVNHNNLAQYKALMAEFTELNKTLARLRTVSNINPIIDIFSENNTTYAVLEYIEGVNLIQYLKDNAGELTWEQVAKLFPPLFTSLSIVHNSGIIHRGISPNTIYYTNKGELKLTGFCISAVRTINTELASEVFKGYAAPEQYSLSSWQGSWTDVYGIAAVLYRILTGCMPTEAPLRTGDDTLSAPIEINPNIPENVSNTIMEGLALQGDSRIQSITDFVTKIFEQPVLNEKSKSATMSIPISKIKANVEKPYVEKPVYSKAYENVIPPLSIIDRIKIPVIISVLLLAILLILAIFISTVLNEDEDESKIDNFMTTTEQTTVNDIITMESLEETTVTEVSETKITLISETAVTSVSNTTQVSKTELADKKMVSLIGKSYDDIKLSTIYSGWLVFEPEFVVSERHEKGIIFEQSIKEGVSVKNGTTVKIKVSSGSGEAAAVPDFKTGEYTCHTIDDYIAMLDKLGISYEKNEITNYGYFSGFVIKVEPGVGTMVDSKSGEKVIVTYTNNPPRDNSYENTANNNGVVTTSPAQSSSQSSN